MTENRTIFPGAMGPHGFISCFDHLLPEDSIRRKIILKGGPGVGKSTFMRRVHAALCGEDTPATLCFCSGDPDSLDAVVIPSLGFIILDGTAPHIVDPAIPGARDSIVNLGMCLDESAMRARLAPIRACMAEHAAASRRARACMRSAEALTLDSAAVLDTALDHARLSRMTRELIRTVLPREAEPETRPAATPVIVDAVTPKGELSFIAENAQPRVIRLAGHWAMDLTPPLRALSSAAQSAGFSVLEYLCPTVPGRLSHLAVPALGILVTTSDKLPSEQTFDFAACLSPTSLLRQECALEQNRAAIRLHMHRAVSALTEAKQLHDELETFYVPNMDFGKWERMFEESTAFAR